MVSGAGAGNLGARGAEEGGVEPRGGGVQEAQDRANARALQVSSLLRRFTIHREVLILVSRFTIYLQVLSLGRKEAASAPWTSTT